MPLNQELFDLAIVGSAFGGSLLASIACRLGKSVMLIERGRHPRFAIGESSTPLTNLFLEQLADRYDLPRIRAFSKWGTWQRTHPGVAAGLKRGFSFYHHEFNGPWTPKADRRNELLVAANPDNDIADTHWYRPDFDTFIAGEAIDLGAVYLDQTELTGFREDPDYVVLSGTRDGKPVEFRARFLVDASGARGFLWRQLRLGEESLEGLPHREALFTHFSGVKRWEDCVAATNGLPTEKSRCVQDLSAAAPPFPPDDAALHHVFPGGWMWVLRFNNGITSAGLSVDPEIAVRFHLAEGAAGWGRMLRQLPSVADQFGEAIPVHPFVHMPSVAFCCPQSVGHRWALLPSAMGFLDPLLSTGFPLTLLGIRHLAELLEQDTVPNRKMLALYSATIRADLEVAAELVGALHHNFGRPAVFRSLSMLYFAAASYSETAIRLNKPGLAPGFLLRGRTEFREKIRGLFLQSRLETIQEADFQKSVQSTIDPINVAGLEEPRKRNWYPVQLEDLYNNRGKVDASCKEIEEMLQRCGIAPSFPAMSSD